MKKANYRVSVERTKAIYCLSWVLTLGATIAEAFLDQGILIFIALMFGLLNLHCTIILYLYYKSKKKLKGFEKDCYDGPFLLEKNINIFSNGFSFGL